MERLYYCCGTIYSRVAFVGVATCTRGVGREIKMYSMYKITGTIVRTPGSGRPSKITAEVKALVERQMRHDDETTAAQLHVLLVRPGFAMDFKNSITVPNISGLDF